MLFDFGNTLFAHDPLSITIAECARRLGVPMSTDRAKEIAERIDAAAMTPQELAHARDLDATVWRQRWQVLYGLANQWEARLGDEINHDMHDPMAWFPYLRTAATLRSLHDHGVAVGIISNTGWDVRTVFAAQAMSGFVTSYTLSYEVGAVKPDRKMFDAACASLGLSCDQVVMVGDDIRADSGAVQAGIRTLLLPALAPHTENGVEAVLRLVGIIG